MNQSFIQVMAWHQTETDYLRRNLRFFKTKIWLTLCLKIRGLEYYGCIGRLLCGNCQNQKSVMIRKLSCVILQQEQQVVACCQWRHVIMPSAFVLSAIDADAAIDCSCPGICRINVVPKSDVKFSDMANLFSPFTNSQLLNHFEILHRARQFNCHAQCKISKWFNNQKGCYGWMSFQEIWVVDGFVTGFPYC